MCEFQCSLFRLSSAPRVFNKLLKPVGCQIFLQLGKNLHVIHPGISPDESPEVWARTHHEMNQIVQLLSLLGFSINHEKSQHSKFNYISWDSLHVTLVFSFIAHKIQQLYSSYTTHTHTQNVPLHNCRSCELYPAFILATHGNIARFFDGNQTASEFNSEWSKFRLSGFQGEIDELLKESEARASLLQRLSGSAVEPFLLA